MGKQVKIQWFDVPEDHDYPSALSYLSLTYDDKRARGFVAAYKRAAVVQFKAKDIFRASGLSLLGTSNSHVEKDREKISAGRKLSRSCWCGMAEKSSSPTATTAYVRSTPSTRTP